MPRRVATTWLCGIAALAALSALSLGQSLPPVPPTDAAALPIDLPTALQLAHTNPFDIAVASERLAAANARLDRAKVLWLPTVAIGADYFRHDGRIQDIVGNVFPTSRSSVMVGAGPNAVFAVSDALYAPLAARQVVQARFAQVQAAQNDSMLAVVEAYFAVQQARGDVAGAAEAVRRADDLVNRVEMLAPALIPTLEINRTAAERARRRQALETAHERWQVASAELSRLLWLKPGAVVEPIEPPQLCVDIIDINRPADELIPVALTSRPELAAHQALVQATLARLKHERMRPLVPSILLRGNATNPGGTLSGGYFGGGVNDNLTNFGGRHSYDVQVVWELQNLGFGNSAAIRERTAENREAVLELFRTQDRVAAEVVTALSQTQRARNRLHLAEEGMAQALQSADKNLEGLSQTKRVGEVLVLMVRPLEATAAVIALDQACRDFYAAVADYNRGQFRLYRALGQPAQCVLRADANAGGPAPTVLPLPTRLQSNSGPEIETAAAWLPTKIAKSNPKVPDSVNSNSGSPPPAAPPDATPVWRPVVKQ